MTRLRDLVGREPKHGIQLPAWLARLLSLGIVSTDEQVIRRQRCVNIAPFSVSATPLSHLVINSLHDFGGLVPVNIENVLVLIGSLVVPRLHRLGDNAGGIALVMMVLVGQTFVVWSFGLASELHVYFTLGGAMLLFFGVQN